MLAIIRFSMEIIWFWFSMFKKFFLNEMLFNIQMQQPVETWNHFQILDYRPLITRTFGLPVCGKFLWLVGPFDHLYLLGKSCTGSAPKSIYRQFHLQPDIYKCRLDGLKNPFLMTYGQWVTDIYNCIIDKYKGTLQLLVL